MLLRPNAALVENGKRLVFDKREALVAHIMGAERTGATRARAADNMRAERYILISQKNNVK
jgi:hypothetical protein